MRDVISREAIEESDYCTITGLRQRTNYGRPNWDSIFADTARKHPGYDLLYHINVLIDSHYF